MRKAARITKGRAPKPKHGEAVDDDDEIGNSSISSSAYGVNDGDNDSKHSNSKNNDNGIVDDEDYDHDDDDDDDEMVGLVRSNSNSSRIRRKKKSRSSKRRHYYDNHHNNSTNNSSFYNNNNNGTYYNSSDTAAQHDCRLLKLRPYWLGTGLFLALFSFWLLDSLKDPIFGALVGGDLDRHQPQAKLCSVLVTLAMVLAMEWLSNEKQKRQQREQEQPTIMNDNDVLDGGGNWSSMNIGTSYNNNINNNDDCDSRQRVPSSIFAYIGIPYCIGFGIMAYLLQFHPDLAYSKSASAGIIVEDHSGGAIDLWNGEGTYRYYHPLDSSTAAVLVAHGNGSDNDMQHVTAATIIATQQRYWRVLGYFLYAGIESFGSLMVATFWSFANSTLSLQEAESFYGTIIATAQLGAIAGSTMVTVHLWPNVTLIVLACLIILLHVVVMMAYSRRYRTDERQSHHNNYEEEDRLSRRMTAKTTNTLITEHPHNDYGDDEDDEPSLWSGVYLILKHNYVLLILGVSCLYEVSLTCLNYQMTLLGWNRFEEQTQITTTMTFTQFMGHYGQMVNVTSLVLSSLAFPWLMRHAGLRRTLRLFPAMLLFANVIAFVALPGNLTVLFFCMSLLKAMTYSIHDPGKEILYLPTAPAIQFKSKFWIDVVGARIAKAIGSSINNYAGSVDRSIRVASAPSLITAAALFYACFKVGTIFETLEETGYVVGIDAAADSPPNDDDDDNIGMEIRATVASFFRRGTCWPLVNNNGGSSRSRIKIHRNPGGYGKLETAEENEANISNSGVSSVVVAAADDDDDDVFHDATAGSMEPPSLQSEKTSSDNDRGDSSIDNSSA